MIDTLLSRLNRTVAAKFGKLLVLLAVLIPLYLGLLWLAAQPDQAEVRLHVQEARVEGWLDKEYPKILLFRGMDMFTECFSLGIAGQLQPDMESLVAMRAYGNCEATRQGLDEDWPQGGPYARYWHGYQVVLRPLMAVTSYANVRIIVPAVTLLLFAGMGLAARRRLDTAHATALLASFITAGTVNVFTLVSHAALFWVIQVGCIALFLRRSKTPPVLGFGLLGSLDAYLNMLNMGSLSLSFPLLCYCLIRWYENDRNAEILADGLLCCVGWSLGLVLTWTAKWGLAYAFLPPIDLFGNTVELYFRHSLSAFAIAMERNFLKTLWKYWLPVYLLLGWRMYKKRIRVPEGLWIVLFPSCMPLIWVMLLPGQSGMSHSSFVSIILWTPLAALLFLILGLPSPKRQAQPRP